MYGWIWRNIPGHPVVRAIWAAALILFVVWLLFEFVFPWIDPKLPWNDVTVERGTPAPEGMPLQ